MAIKKISFNKEGLVSEEELDRPLSKPAVPEKKPKKSRTAAAGKKSSGKSDSPKAKPVKITARAEKSDTVQPGKSLLEQDVIKFVCPRCSSERVAQDKDAKLDCGLCGASMKLAK